MAQEDDSDDLNVIERARHQLAAHNFDDAAVAALNDLLNGYESLIAENRRLVRISEQIRSDLELEAYTDKLTGTLNRERLVELIDRELERATRFDRPMALLLVDIDDFTGLHEKFGDTAGDVVLKALAAAGLGILRRIDSFARIDDDGFAALLPETDTTGAVILAERLRDAVANMGVAVREESLEFTVSVGVVSRGGGDVSAEAMLLRGVDALRAGRGNRHNRVAIAT